MNNFSKSNVKATILCDLVSTNRQGIEKLTDYLETSGFFSSPASTRFHNVFEGGLAEHSYCVFKLFDKMVNSLNLHQEIPFESVVITSLLHDLCKAGSYISKEVGCFAWNPLQPKGHAKLSIDRIENFIELTALEKNIIKYHMGLFGSNEFDSWGKGEYSLQNFVDASNKNGVVSLFHWCDDFDSKFGEKYFFNKFRE